VSVFSAGELRSLLAGRRLARPARLATVGGDGTPHVTPVGWVYHPDHDTIDIGGRRLERTKKYRDVRRTGRTAVVVDDLASTDPWRPRGVEVRGRAEAVDRPASVIRLHQERIVSWGLEGDAFGERHARTAG
jgi:pyridoxamine 5'-phosphate oxidase family protein